MDSARKLTMVALDVIVLTAGCSAGDACNLRTTMEAVPQDARSFWFADLHALQKQDELRDVRSIAIDQFGRYALRIGA